MSKYTGNALYVEWIHSGGTTTLANATSGPAYKSVSLDFSIDLDDATAGGNTVREHLATIKDFTIEYTAAERTVDSAVLSALQVGTRGTLTIGPRGNSTGMPKYSVVAVVESFSTEFSFDSHTEYSVTWRAAGEILASYLNGDTFA